MKFIVVKEEKVVVEDVFEEAEAANLSDLLDTLEAADSRLFGVKRIRFPDGRSWSREKLVTWRGALKIYAILVEAMEIEPTQKQDTAVRQLLLDRVSELPR